jgi:copper resistance protein C
MTAGAGGRWLVAPLGLAALWAVLLCAPALAHAKLQRTSPAAGDTLSQQPGEVRLDFDEPVRAEFDPIKVTDEDSVRVDEGDARMLPDAHDIVVEGLKELPEGSYTVQWHITSADGDPISGQFAFEVDASATDAKKADEAPVAPSEKEKGQAGVGAGPVVVFVLLAGGLAVAGFLVLRGRRGA